MFCSKCGTQNADGSQFCNKCGNNLALKQPANDALELHIADAKQGIKAGIITGAICLLIIIVLIPMSNNAIAGNDRSTGVLILIAAILDAIGLIVAGVVIVYNAAKYNRLSKLK
jgi:uncharacterized membrane protein YvbJ